MVYAPAPLVVSGVSTPVSSFRTLTVAPATAEPVESVTMPVITPRSARCAGVQGPARFPGTCADPPTDVHAASAALRNLPFPSPASATAVADAQDAVEVTRRTPCNVRHPDRCRLADPPDHRHHSWVVLELGDGFLRIPRSRLVAKSAGIRLLGSYANFRAEPMAETQKVGRTGHQRDHPHPWRYTVVSSRSQMYANEKLP